MDNDWGTLVWLVMTTGVRRGELCGLRFSRIDFDEGLACMFDGRFPIAGCGVGEVYEHAGPGADEERLTSGSQREMVLATLKDVGNRIDRIDSIL